MEVVNQPQVNQDHFITERVVASTPTINSSTQKSNSLFSPLGLILTLLVAAVIFLLIQNRELNQQITVSSYEDCAVLPGSVILESYPAVCITESDQRFTQIIQEPDIVTETDIVNSASSGIESGDNLSTYVSTRVNSFHSPFSLTFSSSWQIKTESTSSNTDDGDSTITLTKPGAKIMIQQGAMGAGGCLYPADQPEDGMFSFYEKYTELRKGELVWRIAKLKDSQPPLYNVCEFKSETNRFAGLTQVGIAFLELTTDNAAIVEEFNQIIKSLEILP